MTPDLDAVRAMMEGVTAGPWEVDPDPREGYEWNTHIVDYDYNRVCFMAHNGGSTPERDEATARFIAAARELVPALAAEVEANRATIAELRALVDACAPYLKEGETPAERIEREIKDAIMLMGMLANDRKERDAGRATIENLRQMERNVQAVREFEHQRAEKALTTIAALKTRVEALTALLREAGSVGLAALQPEAPSASVKGTPDAR